MRAQSLPRLFFVFFAFAVLPAAIAEHAPGPATPPAPPVGPPALDGEVVMTDIDDRRALSTALTFAQKYKTDSALFSKALQSVIGAPVVWHWTETNGCLNYRNEALELLGRTPAAWDSYEQMHGPRARAILEEGKKQGDLKKVREAARRYGGTLAALEAQSLLATYYVDRGHPLAAALLFEGLFATARFQAREKQARSGALPPEERDRLAYGYLAAATAFHQIGKAAARDAAITSASALGRPVGAESWSEVAKKMSLGLGPAPTDAELRARRSAFVEGGEPVQRQSYLDALTFHASATRDVAVREKEQNNRYLEIDGTKARITEWYYFPLRLGASECKFGRPGFPAGLTRLEGKYTGIDEERAALIAASPRLATLATLDLEDNSARDEGARAIAASPHLKGLTTLKLGYNRIGPEGAKAIAESPHLKALTSLDLGGNAFGNEGVFALARSPNLKGVTSLVLRSTDVGDIGVIAIAKSPNLAALTTLDLSANRLHDVGAAALSGATSAKTLTSLKLNHNSIGDAGVKAIAASPHLKSLTSLELAHNDLTDAGAKAIAASPHLKELRELDIHGERVGDAGIRAILRSPHLTRLTVLHWRRIGTSPEVEAEVNAFLARNRRRAAQEP